MKKRLREALVVEGRYDRIRLLSVVDALIVETDGFGIFRDKEKRALLRRLAEERGLLVLTDSDAAGFVIRDHLAGFLPPEKIRHAYIPELRGKERRKTAPSKEGLLGVEGVPGEVILEALRRAGATFEEDAAPAAPDDAPRAGAPITKQDFYADGLTGAPDSAARREALLRRLSLPVRLSANRMLQVLNALYTREEYRELLRESESGRGEDIPR
jgi:ribonuclease M5